MSDNGKVVPTRTSATACLKPKWASEVSRRKPLRWQRCRVHFMRNALATVPKLAQQMVAATLRTIFAQPDAASAKDALERICRLFQKRYPALVSCLQEAETDILACYGFSGRAPPPDLVHQQSGATQQGGQPALRCGRHLSQPPIATAIC